MGTDSEGIFKCGAIVAPVTDWRFYHSIYTERYMLTPEQNGAGYTIYQKKLRYHSHVNLYVFSLCDLSHNQSSAIREDAVKNFQNHHAVYMIHGTADDNVHFQNSADLSRFMIRRGVENIEMAYVERMVCS